MGVTVLFSQSFLSKMKTLSHDELVLIGNFTASLKKSGYSELPGRNKPSTDVSENHAQRERLIQYAINNRLWHYHVGHVQYNKRNSFGDWTSQYVIQYQKNQNIDARFVSYDAHPPFKLPPGSALK